MIAIVPARGGSKGLPGKNIKNLCGKPLIAYTLEAALKSKEIERVIVSTDSQEIASIAKQYGAEVPFLRPACLAEDESSAVDVYLHAVEYLMNLSGQSIPKFAVLLPTVPLRDENEIDAAVRMFKEKDATTLISVVEADVPVSWYYCMDETGTVRNAGFDTINVMRNRQKNSKYYIPNGAIYILDYQLLKKERTYYSKNTLGYTMSKEKSVDIDTIDDFEYAEHLMQKRMNRTKIL